MKILTIIVPALLMGCSANKIQKSAPCPEIRIVGDLSKKPFEKGERLELDTIRGICAIDGETDVKKIKESAGKPTHIELALAYTGLRDILKEKKTLIATGFVAFVNPQDEIISKTPLEFGVELAPGSKSETSKLKHSQNLTIPKGLSVEDCKILVGFELTDEERAIIKSNRK
jgi:hypothetical protein